MKHQKGGAVLGLTLGVFAVLGLIVATYFFGYLSFRNTARQFEVDIPAQYTEMQNTYDNGWKKVVEIAQVSDLQAKQVKEVYAGIMAGRYGANGSQAMIQLIKEDNPHLDSSVYTKIQQTIESFHDQFQASQTNLIARKQAYNSFITATTESLFYNWIGQYPKIHVGIPNGAQDDYQILTSDKTQNEFKNHKANALDLSKGVNQ